jgi:hypothetical protein
MGRTPEQGGTRLINCFAERAGDEGRVKLPVYAVDGFSQFAEVTGTGTGGIRAMLPLSDEALYVVSGSKVAKITSSGTVTLLGNVSASGHVTMARNRRETNPGPQIGIATSDGHYYVVAADTVTEVSLTPLESGVLQSLAFIDGYFVLVFDNGEFFATSIDQATTIDPLKFASAESNPDGLVRGVVRNRDVVLCGTASTEFWQNTGAADFPFERTTVADYGCYAAGSMANIVYAREGSSIADTVAFAASDASGGYMGVCLLDGYSAAKISVPALDRAIIEEPDKNAIRACSWAFYGHVFYCLRAPSFCWVYDLATGLWHERKSVSMNTWRCATAVQFGNKTLLGDAANGKIYALARGLYDASAPSQFVLRHSNDGGVTWPVTRTRQISGASDFKQRLRINRLGQSREIGKAFEMSITRAVMENGIPTDMTIQPPIINAWPKKLRFYVLHVDIVQGVSQAAKAKGVLGISVDVIPVN